MVQPVLYLAFANNQHHPYLNLSREQQTIYNLFIGQPASQGFQIHTDPFTSTENLIHYLIEFRNRVSIFHFAGHADTASLILVDEDAGRNGLTSLLGRQKNLRCVFLNGCQTTGFVEKLLQQGVPLIIATNRTVDDALAVTFAEAFYKTLVNGETIGNSFDTAKAAVDLTDDGKVHVRTNGGKLIDPSESGCPWGLYYTNPEALEWKIEYAWQDMLNLPRKFWYRFAILAILLFGAFTWSNLVIGSIPTETILASGPLAVIGICSFLAKHFGSGFPDLARRISWFFLKTPILVLLVAAFLLVSATGSSVRVAHPGQTALHPSLKNKGGNNRALAWEIGDGSDGESRLFAFGLPFNNKANLHMEGYKPREISLSPWAPTRLDIKDFEVLSSLLIRLEPMAFLQMSKIRIEVRSRGQKPIVVNRPGPSIILGARRNVPEDVKRGWNKYFADVHITGELKEQCIGKWENPTQAYDSVAFVPGDTWNVQMYISNNLSLTKEITIEDKPLNDVLLQH